MLAGMADGDHLSYIDGDRLWDAAGREWVNKHTRWTTAKQANAFAKRGAVVGLHDSPGRPLRWLDGDQLSAWWAHARRHFEVPGVEGGKPDDHGLTWGAHVWRRGDERLIVFETFC